MRQVWKLTEAKLTEIFVLFENGWKLSWLGRRFEVDHSTIYYHIKKHHIIRKAPELKEIPNMPKKEKAKVRIIHHELGEDEVINLGKNAYGDYLDESDMRRAQEKCNHPSWKCSVCGLYHNNS